MPFIHKFIGKYTGHDLKSTHFIRLQKEQDILLHTFLPFIERTNNNNTGGGVKHPHSQKLSWISSDNSILTHILSYYTSRQHDTIFMQSHSRHNQGIGKYKNTIFYNHRFTFCFKIRTIYIMPEGINLDMMCQPYIVTNDNPSSVIKITSKVHYRIPPYRKFSDMKKTASPMNATSIPHMYPKQM